MVSLLAAALTAPTAHAQRASVAPWVTGERLLERLEPADPARIPWTPGGVLTTRALAAEHRDMLNREFVEGFLYALHDATEGVHWCHNEAAKIPKPDTFWDESVRALRGLPADQLKRNASSLLIAIWREKWPCPARQRRQE